MCLKTASETKPAPEGVGYKVFRRYGQDLTGFCFGRHEARPVGEWLQASDQNQDPAYPSLAQDVGFHVYKNKDEAEFLAKYERGHFSLSAVEVHRVRYRGAHTQGLGDGGWQPNAEVVVAKEILIEEEV